MYVGASDQLVVECDPLTTQVTETRPNSSCACGRVTQFQSIYWIDATQGRRARSCAFLMRATSERQPLLNTTTDILARMSGHGRDISTHNVTSLPANQGKCVGGAVLCALPTPGRFCRDFLQKHHLKLSGCGVTESILKVLQYTFQTNRYVKRHFSRIGTSKVIPDDALTGKPFRGDWRPGSGFGV